MTLPMQSVPDDGAYETEDYPIRAVIPMSITAAIGSNGLTKYTGLIMCAQPKKKNRPNHMPTGD